MKVIEIKLKLNLLFTAILVIRVAHSVKGLSGALIDFCPEQESDAESLSGGQSERREQSQKFQLVAEVKIFQDGPVVTRIPSGHSGEAQQRQQSQQQL